MKILSDRDVVRMAQENEQAKIEENKKAINESQAEIDAMHEAANIEFKAAVDKRNRLAKYSTFRSGVKSMLIESALKCILDKCHNDIDDTLLSDADKAFNDSLVVNFVKDETGDALLESMSMRTVLLSDLSSRIRTIYEDAIEKVDKNDPSTFTVKGDIDSELLADIKDDSTIEDITDNIRSNVSISTSEFIEKNMLDRTKMRDMIDATKEKIDNVRTGDPETDEAAQHECEMKLKRNLRMATSRPHGTFEQLVINFAEAVLKNDALHADYMTEASSLDMDKIVRRSKSIFTFLEMVNAFNIKKVTPEYIQEAIQFK